MSRRQCYRSARATSWRGMMNSTVIIWIRRDGRIESIPVSHVWGCEFTPQRIDYYFDGRLVQSLDATIIPHGPQNIWLTSVAAPLGGTKAVDDSQLPAVAEFDYVRYFTKSVPQEVDEP